MELTLLENLVEFTAKYHGEAAFDDGRAVGAVMVHEDFVFGEHFVDFVADHFCGAGDESSGGGHAFCC